MKEKQSVHNYFFYDTSENFRSKLAKTLIIDEWIALLCLSRVGEIDDNAASEPCSHRVCGDKLHLENRKGEEESGEVRLHGNKSQTKNTQKLPK